MYEPQQYDAYGQPIPQQPQLFDDTSTQNYGYGQQGTVILPYCTHLFTATFIHQQTPAACNTVCTMLTQNHLPEVDIWILCRI